MPDLVRGVEAARIGEILGRQGLTEEDIKFFLDLLAKRDAQIQELEDQISSLWFRMEPRRRG